MKEGTTAPHCILPEESLAIDDDAYFRDLF
jgi:hypothetical protein